MSGTATVYHRRLLESKRMLKYTVIRSKTQYKDYCRTLEALAGSRSRSKGSKEEIDLLTVLIKKWDDEHSTFMDVDPVSLLHSFLKEHGMKARDLGDVLQVSKGYISDILNYKKGFSKEVIRGLASYFNVSQEAFNRPYDLKSSLARRLRTHSRRNTLKVVA